MAKLVFTSGAETGREVALTDFQVIGRLPNNAVPIPDDVGASRRHTRVYRQKGAWLAVDLGSKNGTLVNGDRVEKAELKDGDVLTVGNTSFRFVAGPEDYAPAAGPRVGADDAVEVGGKKAVGEKALLARKDRAPGAETSTWLRGDLSQRPFLFRALMGLGALLVAAGLFYWAYRVSAGG
ncbi:MAG TPA: FHA domain-containing protein [Planctomycetota bacterium]|nr:FHA domain-containing protein [Planctomycetota bacterium]